MNGRSDSSYVIGLAMSGAAFSMAYQVAGKAARDALFLSNFRSHHLPAMIVAGAVAAMLLGIVNSRFLSESAPGRVIPFLMFTSGALQMVEWFFYGVAPQATAVAVYIHVISLGAVITSGFWSVISEQLDPYTAKRSFGRIAAAGTAGGVAGGFLAERISVWTNSQSVLLFMAAVQLITGALLVALPSTNAAQPTRVRVPAREILRRSSYLRNLSYLVLLGTFSAALLDFLLKSQARFTLGPGEPLMRFFAMFHTGTALLSFLVQTAMTPWFLNRWGIGATVSTLPASVTVSGIFAVLTGGFPAIVAVRGLEAVVRGSLFRAGYELFYTPMLPSEKRAVKSINDVTVDRLGDGFGGAFAQLVISTAGTLGTLIMTITAVVTSAAAWLIAGRLHAAYIHSLERSLAHHGKELEIEDDSVHGMNVSVLALPSTETQALAAPSPIAPAPPPDWAPESLQRQWLDIQSGDRNRIRAALTAGPAVDRSLIPHIVPLLARRSVSDAVSRALQAVAERNVGQLSDFLLDSRVNVAVRTKLPLVIASAGGTRAFDALVRGLCEDRLEVRVECGRALDELRQVSNLDVEGDRVYSAVRHELGRSSKPNLEHVFALLGVVLPRRPVRISFEALNSDDPQLRGIAMEYLESVLPPDIWTPLLALIPKPADQPVVPERPAMNSRREEYVSVLQESRRVANNANPAVRPS